MTLLQKIKKQSIDARKAGAKNEGLLLTTLYAEAAAIGKNNGNRESTDEEVTKVIRKFLNGVEESLSAQAPSLMATPAQNKLLDEKLILLGFLPPELTDAQIKEALDYTSAFQSLTMKSMPSIKSYIEHHYPGAYDGRRVSEALKARMK